MFHRIFIMAGQPRFPRRDLLVPDRERIFTRKPSRIRFQADPDFRAGFDMLKFHRHTPAQTPLISSSDYRHDAPREGPAV